MQHSWARIGSLGERGKGLFILRSSFSCTFTLNTSFPPIHHSFAPFCLFLLVCFCRFTAAQKKGKKRRRNSILSDKVLGIVRIRLSFSLLLQVRLVGFFSPPPIFALGIILSLPLVLHF
ncbi:hypothetical protein IE53DRAFT_88053 [Violaceomyces palustris]|uniref:Uncharacterized protein n=1 Tax=Violaceomyces palustris TaxID=1673888 RepID=A0ACD0NXK8_9BASI|nr:hypothetical protein IE53DRAFT_88053 [Violaceomyces palustris]